jgi:prefoldin beta subunit
MANDSEYKESDIERLIKEYQGIQSGLRSATMQTDQLKGQRMELDTAKEEVEKATEDVYITVGGVIVKTTKEAAMKSIAERLELLDMRIKASSRQLDDLKGREKDLREQLTEMSGDQQKK